MSTLVYTCCNTSYMKFIPYFMVSYAFFGECDVEVGISGEIPQIYQQYLDILAKYLPCSSMRLTPNTFVERGNRATVGSISCIPNTVRFIVPPASEPHTYIYISDIDIICCTPWWSKCLIDDMKSADRKYSNIVRDISVPDNERRMTGLHFSEWGSYYPIPTIPDITYTGNDEIALYQMVKQRNEIDYNTKYRPVFGPHISMNRKPKAFIASGGRHIPGWNYEPYIYNYTMLANSDVFKALYAIMPDESRGIHDTLMALYSEL